MSDTIKASIRDLNLWYDDGQTQILYSIDMNIYANQVTALIGASGCGKSSLLRSINRMNDLISGCKVRGEIVVDGKNIYDKDVNEVAVRTRIGMVFQKPNPFPKSVYDNIAHAPKIHGMVKKGLMCDRLVEESLRTVSLWEDVKDKLKEMGTSLSGGEQQRLCIARAIALKPDILLMDEPTSALDPISTQHIEEAIVELKKHYTIIMVTHNLQQAKRIADRVAYFHKGDLIEYNSSHEIFTNAQDKRTREFIKDKYNQ
ncbi:MAG: phosphate ABC transporter ATP-binding protein [Campylobacterales bacterium]|nr:phosphate ABC transporter ATP-binding protein [Campylobacterales bacterium]